MSRAGRRARALSQGLDGRLRWRRRLAILLRPRGVGAARADASANGDAALGVVRELVMRHKTAAHERSDGRERARCDCEREERAM